MSLLTLNNNVLIIINILVDKIEITRFDTPASTYCYILHGFRERGDENLPQKPLARFNYSYYHAT